MSVWANLVGYQIVWFAAVIGAGRGLWWPGAVAAMLFVVAHLSLHPQARAGRHADLRLMLVAVVCGLLLDGTLALSGFARYAAATPALPHGGAPLWILAMWAAFALTLRHSMSFLHGPAGTALVFGLVGGPLAYLGASRGWQAIVFDTPAWPALLWLAIGWGLAVPLLTRLAVRWTPKLASSKPPSTQAGAASPAEETAP